MEESDLTPRQNEVVESQEKVVLVLGGAGCGKTSTALWAARSELRKSETSRVAFLTFSRTAVDQIHSRAASATDEFYNRIEVSTFHSLAYRIIKSFGRYVGFGTKRLELQSPAQRKLNGPQDQMMSYDDLIPKALEVLRSKRVRRLLADRWPLIICDEFQDTSDDQWEVLNVIRPHSRLLLLADPNQMIYTFVKGVSEKRVREAQTLANHVVELESSSHRDPSGSIPSLAESIMRRNFLSEPVQSAVSAGRLRVKVNVEDDALVEIIGEELREAWRRGSKDFGIFGHSNVGVALLGHQLSEANIDHVLVGLPDAQAEAVSAMVAMCRFAVTHGSRIPLRVGLATFLTACSRGQQAPDLAVALADGHPIAPILESRLAALEVALVEAALDPLAVKKAIKRSWPTLGMTAGNRPWTRAYPMFASMFQRVIADRVMDEAAVDALERDVKEMRATVLLDQNRTRLTATKLMNFYQTKGREADAVILVYRDGDYLASGSEPYEESSRVLYVSLTRARKQICVVLPPDPHPLVAPFAALA